MSKCRNGHYLFYILVTIQSLHSNHNIIESILIIIYYINKYNILSLTDESAPVVSGPSSVRAVSVFCIRRFDETTSRFCVTAFADQQQQQQQQSWLLALLVALAVRWLNEKSSRSEFCYLCFQSSLTDVVRLWSVNGVDWLFASVEASRGQCDPFRSGDFINFEVICLDSNVCFFVSPHRLVIL